MSCYAPGGSRGDAAASEKIRRATLEQMQRQKLINMQTTLDSLHDLPIVDKMDLDKLSIVHSPMLDVDRWSCFPPDAYQTTFFMPFDWPQDWLEYESCEYLEIQAQIGLSLPLRRFRRTTRFGGSLTYHEYSGEWTYLAQLDTDRPHVQCLMLDSGTSAAVRDGAVLRSEIEASICMIQYQLRDGLFANHHTKPILVASLMGGQAARLTQAHFDNKQNKLVLRQSRILALATDDPGDDAWTLLRWMASTPAGLTKYPDAVELVEGGGDRTESRCAALTVPDST